jgi:hypothetical protein
VTTRDRYDEQAGVVWSRIGRIHAVAYEDGSPEAHATAKELTLISLAAALRAEHAAGRREGTEAAAKECEDKARSWMAARRNIRALLAADASEPEREDCPTCHTYGRDPACLDHDEHRVGDVWEHRTHGRERVVSVDRRVIVALVADGDDPETDAWREHTDRLASNGWRRVQRKGEP